MGCRKPQYNMGLIMENTIDKHIEYLEKESERISKIKNGLSLVDRMRPYTQLTHLYFLKMEIAIQKKNTNENS